MLQPLLLVQILLISEFLCQGTTASSNDEGKLISVAVIFRHGDRTPLEPYSNDPYRNVSYWPVDFGQLTNIGKMQQFQLGQWLRYRYKSFLSDRYYKKDIYIRSTDIDRAIMSAQANLAGLFPPKADQLWNENLNWQPIPIHTKPREDDQVLGMRKHCDKHDFLLKKLLESPEFVQINEKRQDFYDYLTSHSGDTIRSLQSLQHIYNTLMIETLYNFTLPDWTKSVFPTTMKPWADFAFAIPCYTPAMARLKAGPILNDILDNFAKATQFKGQKFFMFSGHDSTIANILSSLNVFDYHTIPYAATILFELRALNGSFFVNILYKNTSVPQKMILRGCEYDCPLGILEKNLEPIRLSSEKWEDECKM